jgi:DNA-binding MarR family transcriptional regulator
MRDATLAELLGLIREMRCAAMAGLMRQDVSMGQLHVLWLLEHHGPTPMTRLAGLLDVSLPAATGLIDRMAERGLVERTEDPLDRRKVVVRPGPAGRRALEQTEGLRRDRLQRILRRLDDRSLRRAALAVRDIRRAVLAEAASDTSVGGPGPGPHRHYFTDDPTT